MKVAFIGLGVMGYPMAGHILKAGHQVTVYNRTQAKAQAWCDEYGNGNIATIADTPKKAAQGAEAIFICVGNDDDVRAICYGDDGVFAGITPDDDNAKQIVVDHTTASADLAEELGQYASNNGFGFLDAPVSGGEAGAQNGALTVMVGGQMQDLQQVTPAMQCYSKNITLMGKNGAGQLTKMVNQIFITGMVQSLAEGLNFAMNEGLDCEKLIATLKMGAAQSWQLDNRAETMVQDKFDFGFGLDWMIKDLNYALARGQKNGSTLEVAEIVHGYYQELSAQNYGRMDTSALIKRLRS